MTRIEARHGYEVWAHYDPTAEVVELFASEDGSDYIGCADDMSGARSVAREWIEARHSGA